MSVGAARTSYSEPFFTVKTLARTLQVSERTVRTLIADEDICSVKVAGQRRIEPEAVQAYLDRHRKGRR